MKVVKKLQTPIIYFRRAKCAGTSLFGILKKNKLLYAWDYSFLKNGRNVWKNEFGSTFDFQTKENFYKDNKKILLVPGRTFDTFMAYNSDFVEKSLTFTVVRNPWDKFISAWKFCRSRQILYFKDKSVKDILLNLPTLEDDVFSYWHLTQTQSSTMIYDGKMMGDFIIRFENLQEDFNKLCDKIGYERVKLPHLNETKHKEYWEYFDTETNDIFMERYGEDVNNLGYKF